MVNLKKILKSNLIEIIGNRDKTIAQMSIDYANKDSQYAEAEEKLNDTKLRIANIERGHEKELINKEKQITELKMQIKSDSKRFDGINSAIDTVAGINYPELSLECTPNLESGIVVDDQFYMLKHFKRLVDPDNGADYTINRFGEWL